MIQYLFLDLDNTILDFTKAESIAIRKTMSAYGLTPTDELAARYSAINDWHWKQLELGKMTRDQVLENRFGVLFQELGVEIHSYRAFCCRRHCHQCRRKQLKHQ